MVEAIPADRGGLARLHCLEELIGVGTAAFLGLHNVNAIAAHDRHAGTSGGCIDTEQNDVAVKYTSWSLAFILPDTTLAGAQNLADKLRRAASGLRPPWDSTQITLSAGVVEAAARQEFDSEDIVTDLINRAEFSVEEARKRGGDVIVLSEIPKL